MSDTSAAPSSAPFDADSTRARYSAFLFGVVGVITFIVQPGLVQGLVSILNLTEQQAGFVASAEMMGVALTTIIMSFAVKRVNWQKVALGCLLLAAAGDFASAFTADLNTLMVLRFLSGLGYGGLISISFGAVSLTKNTDRNLAMYLVWVLSYGAAGLLLIPTAFELVGLDGLFIFFGLATLAAIYFVRFLPTSLDNQHEVSDRAVSLPMGMKVVAMFGVLAYNLAQGIAWAYLFLIGTAEGLGEQVVANALTISQVVAIFGALSSVMLATKVRRLGPITVGIFGGALSMVILLTDFDYTTYLIAVCGFNFLWNMVLPFILAKVGDFDRNGGMVVYAISLQMTGLGLGPFVGALALGGDGFGDAIKLSITFFIASFILLLIPARARFRMLKS